jgi:hypothetical protein
VGQDSPPKPESQGNKKAKKFSADQEKRQHWYHPTEPGEASRQGTIPAFWKHPWQGANSGHAPSQDPESGSGEAPPQLFSRKHLPSLQLEDSAFRMKASNP